MDLWRPFDLNQKTLQQFADNINFVKEILTNKEKCELFFARFPFEKLLNVNTMDSNSFILCIDLLDLFSDVENFYYDNDGFNYTMEFILINLSQIVKDRIEIVSLFQLLSKILQRNITSLDNTFKNVFDRERILEVMLKMTSFKTVQICGFIFYSPILNNLLDPIFPDSVNCLVSNLFEKLKLQGVVSVLVTITKLILKSKSESFGDAFQNIWQWLKAESVNLLTRRLINENVKENLLQCLNILLENYITSKISDQKLLSDKDYFYKNLRNVASDICLLSSKAGLRSDIFKLLGFMLLDFFNENGILNLKVDELFNQLCNLPEDIEDWTKSGNDIFFCICHLCFSSSIMLWKDRDVLTAINNCFYTRKYYLQLHVLKSIYYLYPELTHDKEDDLYTKIVTYDLFYYITRVCSASLLYSYNSHQLKWMLEKAPKYFKLKVLTQWLNKIQEDQSCEEIFVNTIKITKTEPLLLELLLHTEFREQSGLMSAVLLRKLKNREISTKIAGLLPLTVNNSTIFGNLILAEPGVSLNSEDSLLLCSIMGAVIPSLNDSQVLRGACVFSSKLLTTEKNNPVYLKEFCRNLSNIRHLIDIVDMVDDETSIEIIRLLKVLVIIQQRNKIEFKEKLTEDFRKFFKGPVEKIGKSLRFLNCVLAYKQSLIAVDFRSVLGLFHCILNYTSLPDFQEFVFNSVALLYKRKPWLAQTTTSSIAIEMACLATYDTNNEKCFLKFLDVWLTAIRNEPYNGFCFVPDTAIKSFIMRISCNERTAKCLKNLEVILKREFNENNDMWKIK